MGDKLQLCILPAASDKGNVPQPLPPPLQSGLIASEICCEVSMAPLIFFKGYLA